MSQPANAKRLLWAGFTAIFAAGIGFAIRGNIFANWAADFGFTGAQLGQIGGAGFTGFCFGIIVGGILADKIGYGKLVVAAFAFHVLSAVVTFGATKGQPQNVAFVYLYIGMFLFALANGTLEAVANPLVATIFPENRTHYLNILHASWPLGLVGGALAALLIGDSLSWKVQLGLYLIPTVMYGVMFLGQEMPKSEASKQGLSIGEMFKDIGILGGLVACALITLFIKDQLGGILAFFTGSEFFSTPAWTYIAVSIGLGLLGIVAVITQFSIGSVLLFALFVAHALVGAVELGTDGWIQNITGNILTPGQGTVLFIITSLVMFGLRFCAHWIESTLKLSPPALLLVCALFAVVGLNLVSAVTAFGGAVGALLVYAIGKTFFWPTMLAVASDRFPRTGAVAISFMGGIGMMSAGLIGSAGLGYAKDRFAGEELKAKNPAVYEQYKAKDASGFLFFEKVHGLDGTKLSEAQKAKEKGTPEQQAAAAASIAGDRKTLQADAYIPAAMAVIYLMMLLYFKSQGGYKPVSLETSNATARKEHETVGAH